MVDPGIFQINQNQLMRPLLYNVAALEMLSRNHFRAIYIHTSEHSTFERLDFNFFEDLNVSNTNTTSSGIRLTKMRMRWGWVFCLSGLKSSKLEPAIRVKEKGNGLMMRVSVVC